MITRNQSLWMYLGVSLYLGVFLANVPIGFAADETVAPVRKEARRPEGFYKDIFMDGGVYLSSRKRLPAAESLGLSYEHYAGKDSATQRELIIGSSTDTNGVLLYPDGQPRFRLIYVNGGGATAHGKSLGKAGRIVLRQFNASGGSYCGSCAGSFLSGRNTDTHPNRRLGYLHIFPYNTLNTGLKKARVGHFIPPMSPLLQYGDFGDDHYVADIYHNNGNWLAIDDLEQMPDVEILATYDTPEKKTHDGAAIWAYKKDQRTGRIVNIGSHPEGIKSGERLELTEACLQYAADGTGAPVVKAKLEDGVIHRMDRATADDDPQHTKIGDRQLHHFTFSVEADATDIEIKLNGENGFDLCLYLNKESPAFRSNAVYGNASSGSTKQIRESLTPGQWFVSVECESTVEAALDETGGSFTYSGNTAVLNGVSYSIAINKHTSDDLAGPPAVSAKAWAIVDGKTGKLLWGSNEHLPLKSASTTKIMCALTVLDLAKEAPQVLEETVVFSELADKTRGSTSGIRAGERVSVAECLYGLLLPSGNDAGNALAEHFNGRFNPRQGEQPPATIVEKGSVVDYTGRSNFIAEMNRRAALLGMSKTIYRLPYGDGGTENDRTTTARDLSTLAWTAMQNPLFRKYVSTREHKTTVRSANGESRIVSWTNTNQLLSRKSYDGIKTGTNAAAGACLVSSGRRGDDHLIVVVLGATSRDGRYVDTRNLYRWSWLQRGHRAEDTGASE
jgi:D-alanyl-D-alanine carboxypeptidase (penicillin-binding protein 5/6)